MKKRSERRKHCALTVVRRSLKFSPDAERRPLLGARDDQILISWRVEMVRYLYLPSLVRIDTRNFELSW